MKTFLDGCGTFADFAHLFKGLILAVLTWTAIMSLMTWTYFFRFFVQFLSNVLYTFSLSNFICLHRSLSFLFHLSMDSFLTASAISSQDGNWSFESEDENDMIDVGISWPDDVVRASWIGSRGWWEASWKGDSDRGILLWKLMFVGNGNIDF